MAPKRRKADPESDDDWNASAGAGSGEESDYAEPSSRAESRKTRVKSTPAAPKRRKVEKSASEVHLPSHPASTHIVSKAPEIRVALLKWFDTVRDARGMPWRKPFDRSHTREQFSQRAYEVWISEIMLQQTQVATVKPYYERWMAKFPTIKDLAAANIDDVNALWKGLGYYSRASRLLAGAQKVVEELDGLLPNNAKDMEAKIPGIGRYSAGAICSIAYGEKVPVLDGNVTRLLSRFLALYANPKAKGAQDILWAGAEAMVRVKDLDYENPGDINQALIELGSTVCKPRDPDCGSCPLGPWCSAYQQSRPIDTPIDAPDIEDMCTLCEPIPSPISIVDFPMKVEKKKAREEVDVVNIVEWRKDGERWFLLVKRPEKGLLAGLQEFPTRSDVGSPSKKELETLARTLLSELLTTEPCVTKIEPIGDVLHVFSHVKKTYRKQWVVLEGGERPPPLKIPESSESSQTVAKGKGKKKASKVPEDSTAAIVAKWVREEDVAQANTSTGVVKIWKLAQSHWKKTI
ncbi:A/G-specific adenine DNA glycosylase [Coprinopsis sp. MPI-PUGE-AT-0042]|nr:A/G-specific adenine DNA glycosylase [Coprinopsis sp. MPI-PUGE-AT-0042]